MQLGIFCNKKSAKLFLSPLCFGAVARKLVTVLNFVFMAMQLWQHYFIHFCTATQKSNNQTGIF
jgi:hypothetical protein